MYLHSLLHFPKNLATNVVLKEGDRAGEEPRNNAMWGSARRLNSMKVAFNIK